MLAEALLGGLGALIVLAFVFASLLAFVPLVMAIVSIMTTFLLLLGLTELTGVSPIVQFLIALVGLGVAIDYSLLVVSRWREERAHGREGDEAVQRAMETAGRAVVFSGTTVAIGLLALVALPLPFLRSIGYGGMLIPLVSTVVAITLLPVVLSTLGSRLDWPHRRTDDKASRAWTRWAEARLAPPLGRRRRRAAGARRARVRRDRHAARARPTPTRSPSRATRRPASSRSRTPGIGEGALVPHEMLVDGATGPRAVAAALRERRRHPRRRRARRRDWRRGGSAIVDAIPVADAARRGGDRSRGVRDAAHAPGAGRRRRRRAARNATSSTRSTATSR